MTQAEVSLTKHRYPGANEPVSWLRSGASRDDVCLQKIAGICAALLVACLMPAAAMAVFWSKVQIGCDVFAITFGVAFAHAILLGLPLFLVFRSRGWVNVATCIVAGFVIGAAPVVVLNWPSQHPQIHAPVLIAEWVDLLTPPIRFGMFGALGGVAFWLVLSSFEAVGTAAVQVRFLQSRRVRA